MSEKSMLEAVENCLIRRPKVGIALGLASNNFIYVLSNTALCAGLFGNDFILVAYYRDSFARLAPKLGSCAATYKLSTGEVRNSPRQSLSPWLCMAFKAFFLTYLRWGINYNFLSKITPRNLVSSTTTFVQKKLWI